MREGNLIKSTIFSARSLSEVVHTIPLGLLTARSTGRSPPVTRLPPHTISWEGNTRIPVDARFPSTNTSPAAILRSASRREQTPASLKYLFRRIPLTGEPAAGRAPSLSCLFLSAIICILPGFLIQFRFTPLPEHI